MTRAITLRPEVQTPTAEICRSQLQKPKHAQFVCLQVCPCLVDERARSEDLLQLQPPPKKKQLPSEHVVVQPNDLRELFTHTDSVLVSQFFVA